MFWVILILVLIFICLWKFKDNYTYWERNGVLQLSFAQICLRIFQNSTYKKKSFYEMVQEIYEEFPKNKFHGSYQLMRQVLVLRDPELIKQLTVKDFDHFVDHMSFMPEDSILSKNLFGLKGDKWKDMRATLSPAFTSSKMRLMFSLMSDCADEFVKYFEERKLEVLDVELKDVFTRFTNDVIATCAFGVNCNSMKEKENEFYVMGKDITNFTVWKNFKMMFVMAFPKLAKILRISIFGAKSEHFFNSLVAETIKVREEKNIVRLDMIHLLLEARKGRLTNENSTATETGFATALESDIGTKMSPKQKLEITDEDITAQAMIFFLAGFESVAFLMSFVGYELAVHPEIQERLQQEIDDAFEQNGKITYEMVNKMKYLDMVISETLRKWPAAPASDRNCVVPYDLTSEHLKLNKGDAIWIPIWALHNDPNYFPNPEKFDPERFSEENRHNITPYTYMPFGVGPRNCIASRFALMEVKVIYIKLLSKFKMVVIGKTPIPMVLQKNSFKLSPVTGFWVGLRARN